MVERGKTMAEAYKTVGQQACDAFTEKRSRFIGYIQPVQTEEEALSFIQSIKSKHWDAKHNVYAYCLREGQIKRYSDDGEPQGTAGIPTLDVLLKTGVTDVAVVVTRYFGGILLGGGGLVRAYSHAARLAVEKAGVITMAVCKLCTLTCDYNQYGRVAALIPECGGFLDDSDFGEAVSLSFHMAEEALPAFEAQLADATCGSVSVRIDGERFFQLP
ncbi:MAG: YigZ family protein [Oscillospiraceae bacterium]|nr:YigZ family protein [Oscillospiraceae bacterium]